MAPKMITRRDFVKETGGLVIGFSFASSAILPQLLAADTPTSVASPLPNRLDAWLRVEKDGTITVFTGKPEIGMGIETAYGQIVAEELDVAPEHVHFVMADTAFTTNQGGVGGSTSISLGSKPLRNAAANARYMLVQLASKRLGVPPEQLQVQDGIVSVMGDPSKSVSYADLAGGTDLDEMLKVTGDGFTLDVQGMGKPKDPSTYKIVGQSRPRVDIGPKVLGKWEYVVDVRVPGMVHGRVIRPAGVGSTLVQVDDSAAKQIVGYQQTVVKGNFVGVVAQNEWAAIQAAKAMKVTWTPPKQSFPEQADLYQHMRAVAPKASHDSVKVGDADAAFSSAAKTLEASYEFPFQSHATMGPGCAVADVHTDGVTTVWSGGQKPHDAQKGVSELLHVDLDKVRVIWKEDAGSYGRPGFEDTVADAVLLSQAVGKPVRVQWMRHDMHAWGSKGPAVMCDMAAAIDSRGEVSGVKFTSWAFSGTETNFRADAAGNFLGAQLTGIPNTTGHDEFARWGASAPPYVFPNLHAVEKVVPAFYDVASPLRTSHMRDPEGPQTSFAVESFIDEIAVAAGVDPIELRIKHIEEKRAAAVLRAAAEKAGWVPRSSPNKAAGAGDVVTGRGVSLGTRNGTYVGTIAEVQVNRKTGVVHVTRLVCAHDCGMIINPESIRATVAANLIQSLSRTMKEEVMFDRNNVTSVDWRTYQVARASDIPDQVDIILINRPDIPPSGAGEPSSRPTPGAIANAIFDATGVRVRQAPLTPARVKAALLAAQHA
jgi:nicotinate dehydrogenase subunit B